MTGGRRPPTETVAFAWAGYRGEVLRGAERAVHVQLLPDPMARAREGRVLRTAVSRQTSRVVWDGVGAVLLKVHATRSYRERLLSLVRRGRARAEWEAARYLDAAGVPVPEPLAVGAQRKRGLLRTSFYAARFLEGMHDADAALRAQPPGKRALLHERLAVLIRRMHALGFDHRDLHAGNVLVGPGPGEACRIVLTDLHRSTFGGTVRARARRRAVAQWLHSLREDVDAAGRRVWLAAYLGPEEAGDLDRWQADVEARMARRERVRRRSRGKRCLLESTVYTRDVGPGWGARRRDLSLARLGEILVAHGAASAPGRPGFLKRSRKGVVTRVGGVVVKERRDERWWHRLRDAVLPRRHAAGYVNAHRLGVLGVDTAKPLAHVRRGGRAYTLYEDLGDLPRLDLAAREAYAGSDREAQVRLREASATWLGGLHREGIYHGDLKGVNVLVGRAGDTLTFHLIDTDRCRFFERVVDPRRRIKNLSQLAASIGRGVSRTERWRWFRDYVRSARVPALERETARAVARQLARKILVVDEPIE